MAPEDCRSREPMTASEIKAPDSGSYPGPISAINGDSAAFITFTPPASPNPVNLVLATAGGRTLGPAHPIGALTSPSGASFLSATAGWVLGTKAPTAPGAPSVAAILATADGGATWAEQFSRPAPK